MYRACPEASRKQTTEGSNKGRKLSDIKGIPGKGRLTTGKMDVLQNYYDFAIRGNLDNVEEMAKAVKASPLHVASTEENPQHHLCPKGKDSWCAIKEIPKHTNIRMVFQNPLLSWLSLYLLI
jgi:hypothetical protein